MLVLVKLRCDQDRARHRISMVKLEVVNDIGRPRLVSTLSPHRNQLIKDG